MPHVTKQLGNESGVQFQGVTDASSVVSRFPVVGLIIGKFRRGRYDKPMTVSLRNIRALLGHDPKNPDYLAVLQALEDGVPSVQVLRLKSDLNENSTHHIAFVFANSQLKCEFNGQVFETLVDLVLYLNENNQLGVEIISGSGEYYIANNSQHTHKFKIYRNANSELNVMTQFGSNYVENPSLKFTPVSEGDYTGYYSFTLSAYPQ